MQSFFTNYLEVYLRQRPLEASQLGDHRFDDLLDDISAGARARWLDLARRTLERLPREVDYGRLSREGQIDFEILRDNLKAEVWETENLRSFEEDPRTYGNYLSDGVYSLLARSSLPREVNVSNSLARMAQLPRIVAEAERTLGHPPRAILDTAILQNRGAIDFYKGDILEFAGETPQLERLKAAAAQTAALLEEYQKFLEGPLKERANGEWRLGKRKFDKKFELETEAGITAEENLADAEREFARVRREMYGVARQLWCQYYPERTFPADDAAGEREAITRVIEAINREHGKPEELIGDAKATVERIKEFIRKKNYITLPEPDLCQVIEMPEFRRGNSLAYMDNAPPLDPKAASYYAVSPPPADWDAKRKESFLEEYNHYMLQILTIHEGYPGHYVQLAQGAKNGSLIRKVFGSGVYIEGWAVYGEITMLNEGYGGGDERLRMMQLKFYLRAVANSIIDYKMHCLNMGEEEMVKFLVEEAFQSDGEARLKLIRARQSSVQLSTYFVGRMAHYRLHQQIEREMGDGFNLGRYHDAVVGEGAIPVKYLPEVVRMRLGVGKGR